MWRAMDPSPACSRETVHEGRETHLCALGHASPRARVHAPEVALDGVLAVPVRDEAATRVQQLLRLVQDRPLPHADQERPLALIAGESRYTSPLGGAGVGDLHPPPPESPTAIKVLGPAHAAARLVVIVALVLGGDGGEEVDGFVRLANLVKQPNGKVLEVI